MNQGSRLWTTLVVVNLVVTALLAIWVVLFATGTDSLLPPALDPNQSEATETTYGREATPSVGTSRSSLGSDLGAPDE